MIFPSKTSITKLIYQLQHLLFPGHFENSSSSDDVRELLRSQIETSLIHRKQPVSGNDGETSEMITNLFFQKLPMIRTLLLKDAEAGFNGDPAAYSTDEIILTYPGFFAVFVYRMAHELSCMDVPLIPRMMCEYAHSKTGIDIHPKAAIGGSFFIDHGTGVVIGETAIIGNNVKLYQGVTIGALSTKNAQQLAGKKRHPTIGNDVIVYAGAAILGGDTVIGNGTTIGGNSFVTESVPPNSKIKGI
jgi:Serine acetyltransferase